MCNTRETSDNYAEGCAAGEKDTGGLGRARVKIVYFGNRKS